MDRFFDRLVVYIGLIGSVVTILLASIPYWAGATKDSRVAMGLLAFFAWVFLLAALFQEWRYPRKTRYAEVIHIINDVFIRSCVGSVDELSPETLRATAKEVCNQMAAAFTVITGTRCSACIKVIDQSPAEIASKRPHLSFSTLCRDINSEHREPSKPPKEVVHSLDGNTAIAWIFTHLGHGEQEIFFENDLPGLRGYQNTSFKMLGEPRTVRFPIFDQIVRRFTWPLPYKSAIVSPVFPLQFNGEADIVGFFAIDSASRNVFLKRYDRNLVRNISAAVYPLVRKWIELVNQAKGGENV